MKAIQSYAQTKVLKSKRATAIRQLSDLNRLCPQYPGADCEVVLTKRKKLYKEVEYISNELKEMTHNHRIKPFKVFDRPRTNVRLHITTELSQQILGT